MISNVSNPNSHTLNANVLDTSAKDGSLESNEVFNTLPVLFDNLAIKSLPVVTQQLIKQVDACLPQTQCGLCEHPDGCLPYAHAIVVEGEAHNKCVPGGQPVSDAISIIMGRDKMTAVPSKWTLDPVSERPKEVRAVIREADCIGCTKCIPACPVDAIIGTGKHMHTIFTDLCTGCELCLPPCPVDCIDLLEIERTLNSQERIDEQHDLRQRYYTHLDRVATQVRDNTNEKPVTSMIETKLGNAAQPILDINADTAKATIAAAKLRTKIKKLKKQLAVRDNSKKQSELNALEDKLAQLNESI